MSEASVLPAETARGIARRQIAELSKHVDGLEMNLFICEYSNDGCPESLEITPGEYQTMRPHGARFVVLPGHQLPGIEHVAEGNGRLLVVENHGTAAEVALADDPPRS